MKNCVNPMQVQGWLAAARPAVRSFVLQVLRRILGLFFPRSIWTCAPMKVTVIGAGYVGQVTGTCLAYLGHEVVVLETDQQKVARLQSGHPTIYEPGLDKMLGKTIAAGRLRFTADSGEAIRHGQVVFIAVGTPAKEDGSCDLQQVDAAARMIAGQLDSSGKLIVIKSTVPPGTAQRVRNIIASQTTAPFEVANAPEFLREGCALRDFMRPDRIVVGGSPSASATLREVFRPILKSCPTARFIAMSSESAELVKLAANAMLAVRISYANEIAAVAACCGANYDDVREGYTADRRIGPAFTMAGAGYGGSCFPKDVQSLVHLANASGVTMSIAEAAHVVNEAQKHRLAEMVVEEFGENLSGRLVAVAGLAFKPESDDVREAPALVIINDLLQRGARVRVTDPQAMEPVRRQFGTQIEYCTDPCEAARGADALLIVTEWDEYRNLNLRSLKSVLRQPVVMDGRRIFSCETMAEHGFTYYSIGRPPVRGAQLDHAGTSPYPRSAALALLPQMASAGTLRGAAGPG